MKIKSLCALLVGALVLVTLPSTAQAKDADQELVAAEVIVRPVCLVATACGFALFIVSLPFTAIAGDVDKTADTLIGKPARATFTREMGDFDDWN